MQITSLHRPWVSSTLQRTLLTSQACSVGIHTQHSEDSLQRASLATSVFVVWPLLLCFILLGFFVCLFSLLLLSPFRHVSCFSTCMDMGTGPYRQRPLEDRAWSLAIPGGSLGRDSQVSGFSGWTAPGHAVVLAPLSLLPRESFPRDCSSTREPRAGGLQGLRL